eukprot:4059846-Amphidinium_carterae.1
MNGCRSAELATGAHLRFLDHLQRSGQSQLLSVMGLTPEQIALLVADYELACSRISAMVQVKLNFWSQLPWRLCG